MTRRTYGRKGNGVAFRRGNPASATPSRDFPDETLYISDVKKINILFF